MKSIFRSKGLVSLSMLAMLIQPLRAEFTPLEDFESFNQGELSGQGGWAGDTGYLSVIEESGNKAARFNAPNSSGALKLVYRDEAISTPENTTTTLFFRMKLPAYGKTPTTTAVNIVALRNANLNGGGDFTSNRCQMSLEQDDAATTASPALHYRNGSTNTFGTGVNPDEWINVWIVMSRGAGTSGSWNLHMNQGSGGWQAGDFSATGIAFRNTASVTDNADLALFNPANNTVDAGALVDDFHYDAGGSNLANPLPEPFGFADFMQAFYPGVTDPLIVGETADPDRDGRLNSWEFRFGTPPNDPANPGRPQMEVVDGLAILDFNRQINPSSGAIHVEWSEQLTAGSWEPLPLEPVTIGPGTLLPGHYERVEAYIQLPNYELRPLL
ncbi:MAG: hypothetical protein ACP5I4_14120 [Oceanipulchritudo sp.]